MLWLKLTKTFEWCCTNYLLINPTKTKVMIFGVPQLVSKVPQDTTFTLMDKQLIIASNAKDLGVTLDIYLNYNDHVADVVSSCMRALVQINRVRHLFKREMLIQIINCLVFSKYCCSTVWASISEMNLGKLQCVQNFAARIVTGMGKFERITPILKDLRWLPVTMQLHIRDAVMTFKCVNGLAPSYLCEKLNKRQQISGCITRQSNDFQIPKCRTATGQKSFVYRSVSIWNSLCPLAKQLSSVEHFKHYLKKQFLNTFLNTT